MVLEKSEQVPEKKTKRVTQENMGKIRGHAQCKTKYFSVKSTGGISMVGIEIQVCTTIQCLLMIVCALNDFSLCWGSQVPDPEKVDLYGTPVAGHQYFDLK